MLCQSGRLKSHPSTTTSQRRRFQFLWTTITLVLVVLTFTNHLGAVEGSLLGRCQAFLTKRRVDGVPRGGGSSDNDTTKNAQATESSGDGNVSKTQKYLNPAQMHRLREDVMAESEKEVDATTKSNKKAGKKNAPPEKVNKKAEKEVSPPVPAKKRNRWRQALDSNRAGAAETSSSNKESDVINDAEDDQESEDANLVNLWWVNLWLQNLPGDAEDMNASNVSTIPSKKGGTKPDAVDPKPEHKKSQEALKQHKKSQEALKQQTKNRRDTESSVDKTTVQSTDDSASEIKGNATIEEAVDAEAELLNVSLESQEDAFTQHTSSGVWSVIDTVLSVGLSEAFPSLKASRKLRPLRKAVAGATGFHGVLSGKRKSRQGEAMEQQSVLSLEEEEDETLDEEDLGKIRRRIEAIDRAREKVEAADAASKAERKGKWWRRNVELSEETIASFAPSNNKFEIPNISRKTQEQLIEEQQRKERVKEIDKLIGDCQKKLQELACEKDVLQKRPNPLWNYTTQATVVSKKVEQEGNQTNTTKTVGITASRKFNFPPQDLVEEYLDVLFSNGRLVKMNHSDLWLQNVDDDEDEMLVDDLFATSSMPAAEEEPTNPAASGGRAKKNGAQGAGGSWLLRQSIGKGSSFGEKLGEVVEKAAYKSICQSIMGVLAKSLSSLHGVNIMTHTDIRLFLEQTPDLPPVSEGIIPGGAKNVNYAREAIEGAVKRAKKQSGRRRKQNKHDATFIQRAAVVETLLSQCQNAAPLLKVFPLAWQRALLGNIITLIAAVMSDFCHGVKFEILGHQLSFSFTPITESDMLRYYSMAGPGFNRRSAAQTEQFEAAVKATAEDVGASLTFLDRWHERALGSGMLRMQIANLIARIVLTLADEVLGGARMDLWSDQAGGPRMHAGLEFRTTENYMS